MDIINLGKPISEKIVTIEQLPSNNGYVILGTPQLTRNEIYELMGVLKHEINYRDKILNDKVKQK